MENSLSNIQQYLQNEDLNITFGLNELMSKHTSYKIGGPAKFFARVNDLSSLKKLLNFCQVNTIEWFIVGKGSNLLVSDDGYNGLIIVLDGQFKKIIYNEIKHVYDAGAGASLAHIVNDSKKRFVSGFEFAVGTPGSIGGAIKMNAGTANDWIASRIIDITYVDKKGNIKTKPAKDFQWGYRQSSFSNQEIVLSARFKVKPLTTKEEKNNMIKKMEALLEKRHASQPLNYPSCGSVFKNPENNSSGKLIDEAGLKGKVYGGAQISTKHANFIVNKNHAKAKDVLSLIHIVQNKVYDNRKIKLHPEVKFVGFKEICDLFN